tara:strand:+ start:1352 stop:1843 length:492 start_codon:yes stop_codon:yes gene_type:complete
MELINSNNVYIDIGDNQYKLIQNEYIYEFKKYYFKNTIKIKYANHIFNVNLKNEKYFQIKIINIGNFILLYIFNKKYFLFNKIINIQNEQYKVYEYNNDIFLKYKLIKLINILKTQLGNKIILPQDIIFNIINKLNIIENTMDELDIQRKLYYIEYIKSTFLI